MNKNTIQQTIEEIYVLSPNDEKDLIRKTLKLGEEFGELSEAVLSFEGSHGCTYKGKTSQDILEEGADVIIVAFSILEKVGFSLEEVQAMMDKKLGKWLEKLQSH